MVETAATEEELDAEVAEPWLGFDDFGVCVYAMMFSVSLRQLSILADANPAFKKATRDAIARGVFDHVVPILVFQARCQQVAVDGEAALIDDFVATQGDVEVKAVLMEVIAREFVIDVQGATKAIFTAHHASRRNLQLARFMRTVGFAHDSCLEGTVV